MKLNFEIFPEDPLKIPAYADELNYFFRLDRLKEIVIAKSFSLAKPGPNTYPKSFLSKEMNDVNIIYILNSIGLNIKNYSVLNHDRLKFYNIKGEYLSYIFDGKAWEKGGAIDHNYWTPGDEIMRYKMFLNGIIIE